MLNINNKNDIEKMMQYHRARDMINLINFFPDLSAIRNLTIITSIDDYNKNYELCKQLPGIRNDTLITKPPIKSIEAPGFNFDAKAILEKVKEIDPDGVLLLFDLCHKPSERYDRYGINIGISIGASIYIDAVGKGFDGREVSKGISAHERFYIPWFELRKCNVENFRTYRTYLITQKEYQISRCNRIAFLQSLGLPLNDIQKHIPKNYQEIPDNIWEDILINLIKKLEKMQDELVSVNLTEFTINGNVEEGKFYPWQLYDKSRYIKNI